MYLAIILISLKCQPPKRKIGYTWSCIMYLLPVKSVYYHSAKYYQPLTLFLCVSIPNNRSMLILLLACNYANKCYFDLRIGEICVCASEEQLLLQKINQILHCQMHLGWLVVSSEAVASSSNAMTENSFCGRKGVGRQKLFIRFRSLIFRQ